MANCQQACEDMVRNYAQTGLTRTNFQSRFFFHLFLGCGKTIGGSKTVAKYDAGGCGKGVGKHVHVCA